MTRERETSIRAFDGSLSDAKGLLAVERATFDESPYNARQVQELLRTGPQAAWVAIGEGNIVGFAIAFATEGLSGPSWEVDLLAVHPHWRGRGLATYLIRAAVAGRPARAARARAVVATDNEASLRAFRHAGFQPAADICTLLIYHPADAALRPRRQAGVHVHAAASLHDAAPWLDTFHRKTGSAAADAPDLPETGFALMRAPEQPGLSLLLAGREGAPAGYAELIQVQTLLYRGAWIESLVAPDRAAREALVEEALQRGITAGWDELGAMVPEPDWAIRNILRAQGFRSLGDFHWMVANLPSPGDGMPREAGRTGQNRPGPAHG